uniref:Nuclear pore complex protein Nup85 n=1 Tax=Globodera rostochiensis TaxID=31243 RepID=A0A914HU42_GLORO
MFFRYEPWDKSSSSTAINLMERISLLTTNDGSVATAVGSSASAVQCHPVQRCLLYDFHSIFVKGRSIAQNIQGGTIRLEGATLLSKRYRAAIKRSIKLLEQNEYHPNQSVQSVQQLGEELCSFSLLWSLIEAVTFRPSHNLIVVDLLEWAYECFPSAQSLVPSAQHNRLGEPSFLGSIMEELMQQERPEDNESYWNAVLRQMLCADLSSVVTLLQFHSAFKNDAALSKMTKILQDVNISLFKRDRTSCEAFLAAQKRARDYWATHKHLFHSHDNLGVLCSLLIVLPAFTLFFYPSSTGEQMPKVIESFFNLVSVRRGKLSQLEQTILSIIELDLIKTLRLICTGGHSACWFATHLVDLLHFHDPNFLSPILTATLPIGGAQKFFDELSGESVDLDLRARLLVEYVQLLFQDDQLWEIASDYLVANGLGSAGLRILDQLVGQFNWRSNTSVAQRLLTICDRYELKMAREDILRSVVLMLCRQGEWSSALGWALQMGSNELTIHVSRRILEGAISSDRIGQMRIFEALDDKFLNCSELILLYKFYTFKRLLVEGELRQAVHILHELFIDNSSPMEFHAVLFEEMIRILCSFQQPLIGLDALNPDSENTIAPGLDRELVQEMFRALSMLHLQQQLLATKASGASNGDKSKGGRGKALFPPINAITPSIELNEKVANLMETLRPMLTQALANCFLD